MDEPVGGDAFYLADGVDERGRARFVATGHTNSPWAPGVQHGGPPAALLGRALEALPGNGERFVARLTMDLWGPVPVGPLTVSAQVERPGRSVELVSAQMTAQTATQTTAPTAAQTGPQTTGGERVVARASAWRLPARPTEASTPGVDVPPGPEHGVERPRPASWVGGYLDAVQWQWVQGAVTSPGPATVWMRPRVPLVAGEQMSPLQRVLACADSASGASAALDPGRWSFLNTELTVHLVRPAEGEWVCVDAETTLAGTSTGLAAARLLDAGGLVGRSAQALLVTPR